MRDNSVFTLALCQLFTVVCCLVFVNAFAALDSPHDATRNVGCLSCHQMNSTYPKLLPDYRGTNPDPSIDNTVANSLCWSCHIEDGTAPYMATHSNEQTDASSGNWAVECWVCHNQHSQEQNHYNGSTYGKFIRRSINLADITGLSKSGKKAVVFTGPATFADSDTTYNGVCEVCHTGTVHYRNDGSSTDQSHGNIAQFGLANPGLDTRECTFCHSHQDGFRPSCPDCHGLPPTVATPGGPNGLVGPGARIPVSGRPYGAPAATGSATSGQHQLHATPAGYNYPCATCHSGGMHATMTAGDAKVDHQIQIGFSGEAIRGMSDGQDTSYNGQTTLAGYTYQGTNGTTTSTNGAMTCANTYCHSDGTSVSTGVIAANTSAPWNSGPITCGSCHEYGPAYDLYAPKANSHVRHDFLGCEYCHYPTTTDGMTIANRIHHVNGQYDLGPSPTFHRNGSDYANTFDYIFDTGGGTCSNISCHAGLIAATKRWGNVSLTPAGFSFDYTNQGCYGITITNGAPSCYPASACEAPYTYNWVFSDGYTYTSSGTFSSVYREFGASNTYTATVTVISATGLNGVRTTMPFTPNPPTNVLPTPDFSISADGLTVTLADQSFDTDYTYCGHSGPGRVLVDWGPGGWVDYGYILNLTDTPSGQVIDSYTYASPGTYTVRYGVYDNVITYPEFTQKTVTVTIP